MLLASASLLQYVDGVAANARLELRSTGSIVRQEAAPATEEILEWPATAMVKGEVNLGLLKGGTQPYKIKIGSTVFVRKKSLKGGQPQAIMMEALTNHLYDAVHVGSEQCRFYPATSGSKNYMLCRWIDGLKPVFSFTAEVKKTVSQFFVLDAVFGNYDVGGTTGDNRHRIPRGNVGWDKDHHLIRIDNGGALAADALGAWKPTQFDCKKHILDRITTWAPEPFQLWDFRIYSDIYDRLSQEEIVAQARRVLAMKTDLLAAVDSFGNMEASEKVKDTLVKRLACLERISNSRADLLHPKHLQASKFYNEIPKEICEGVHALCKDLS